MDAIATGIAHVSFAGGGTFLPTRTPYQRQMLVEHVLQCVRANGRVQVLVHDQRWMVYLRGGASTVCCSRCGHSLGSAVYSTGDATEAYCAECALGGKQGNAMRCAPLPVITDAA